MTPEELTPAQREEAEKQSLEMADGKREHLDSKSGHRCGCDMEFDGCSPDAVKVLARKVRAQAAELALEKELVRSMTEDLELCPKCEIPNSWDHAEKRGFCANCQKETLAKAEKDAEALRERVKELIERSDRLQLQANKTFNLECDIVGLRSRAEAAEKALAEAKDSMREQIRLSFEENSRMAQEAAESAVRDRDARIAEMREGLAYLRDSVHECSLHHPDGFECCLKEAGIESIAEEYLAKTPSPSAQEPAKCVQCGGSEIVGHIGGDKYSCPKCRPSAQEKL